MSLRLRARCCQPCDTGDRLSAVLEAGLHISKQRTGMILKRPMSAICPICLDPFFGCARDSSDKGGGDFRNCIDDEGEWTMRHDTETGVQRPVVILTECQHQFHVDCIASSLEKRPTCPMCNQVVTTPDIIDIHEALTGQNENLAGVTSQTVVGGVVYVYNTSDRRLVREERSETATTLTTTIFYEGVRGAERKIQLETKEKIPVVLYEGGPTHEELRTTEIYFYNGEKGSEKLVRVWYDSDGQQDFYEGEKGAERKVRTQFTFGDVQHFEGDAGDERMVRYSYTDGREEFFEGEAELERKVRTVYQNGTVDVYDGAAIERHVRTEYQNGTVSYYAGDAGSERHVRTEFPNNLIQYYAGEAGSEKIVGAVGPDGVVYTYEGEAGSERQVRMDTPDGRTYLVEKGSARRFVIPDDTSKRLRTSARVAVAH